MKEDKRCTCTSRNCPRYARCDTAVAEVYPMPWIDYYPNLCREENNFKYFVERDDKERDKWRKKVLMNLNTLLKEPSALNTIETDIFDVEEIYPNCTVKILKNSITGKESIRWRVNDE